MLSVVFDLYVMLSVVFDLYVMLSVVFDKVILINSDLKIIRSVYINGYIVQGQWIGYTILITTKKDVQYLDILSKPQQAYCLENMEKKYLVLKVMADRIFGI